MGIILNERQNTIMEYIRKHNTCKIIDLSEWLQVSEMTIRRDLEVLEQKGEIIRTIGGAKYKSLIEFPFQERKNINLEEKKAIAKIASSLINEKDSIILDASSTAYVLSDYLPDNITVITTNIQIVMNLLARENIEVILIGGKVRKKSASTIGFEVLDMVDKYKVDKVFFSSKSLDLDKGISDATVEEGIIKKKFIEVSEKSYLMMDTTKVNAQSFYKVGTLADVSALITNKNDELNKEIETECAALNIEYFY